MDELRPTLVTRVHEWLADHVSWIQYPRRSTFTQADPRPSEPTSPLLWLLTIIPVPFLYAMPLVLVIYLGVMYWLYLRSINRQ